VCKLTAPRGAPEKLRDPIGTVFSGFSLLGGLKPAQKRSTCLTNNNHYTNVTVLLQSRGRITRSRDFLTALCQDSESTITSAEKPILTEEALVLIPFTFRSIKEQSFTCLRSSSITSFQALIAWSGSYLFWWQP
jgi:hypothetical protein